MTIWLTLTLLGAAWAQDDADEPCDKWGRIVPISGPIGNVGGEVLSFEVGGTSCETSLGFVDPDTCEWYLDPSDGSLGDLQFATGETNQWRPPVTLDICPPALVDLYLECMSPNGDFTLDVETLTVDDPNNRCSASGGGCISPSTRGAWVFVPLLFLGGFRRRSAE